MASLDELEEEAQGESSEPHDPEEDEEDDEDDPTQDLYDCMGLLSKCMHLMSYLADADLCKTITKRERATMFRLSEDIRAQLDSLEGVMDEEEEE